jgi:hypothetical protein
MEQIHKIRMWPNFLFFRNFFAQGGLLNSYSRSAYAENSRVVYIYIYTRRRYYYLGWWTQRSNRARCAPARPCTVAWPYASHLLARPPITRPFNPAPPALTPPPPPSRLIDPVPLARPPAACPTSRHCILHPTSPPLTSASSCSPRAAPPPVSAPASSAQRLSRGRPCLLWPCASQNV